MRKFLFGLIALLAFLPSKAKASTDVNVVFGSATYSGACVTTGTAVQVDMFVHGVATATMTSNRIAVVVQNQDTNYNIWCGFDSRVSTNAYTISGVPNSQGYDIGVLIKPNGNSFTFGMLRQGAIWCQAADGAQKNCVWIHQENVYKE